MLAVSCNFRELMDPEQPVLYVKVNIPDAVLTKAETGTGLERNKIYIVDVLLSSMGSSNDAVEAQDEELRIEYHVIPWTETNMSQEATTVKISDTRYLMVSPLDYILKGDGVQSVDLQYFASISTSDGRFVDIDQSSVAITYVNKDGNTVNIKGTANKTPTTPDATTDIVYTFTAPNNTANGETVTIRITPSGMIRVESEALDSRAIKTISFDVKLLSSGLDAEHVVIRHFPLDNIQSITGEWSSRWNGVDNSIEYSFNPTTSGWASWDGYDENIECSQAEYNSASDGKSTQVIVSPTGTPSSYDSRSDIESGGDGSAIQTAFRDAVPRNNRQGANSEANAYDDPSSDYWYWGQTQTNGSNGNYDWYTGNYTRTYYRWTTYYRRIYYKNTTHYYARRYYRYVSNAIPDTGSWVAWGEKNGTTNEGIFTAKVYYNGQCYPISTYNSRGNGNNYTNLKNNHMYVIQITSTSDKYALGRPVLDGNYQSQDKVASPAFMIASQLGAVSTTNDPIEASTHCGTYMEVGTDGTRYVGWRLPTKQEIEVIIGYQDGAYTSGITMVTVLGGQYYWALDGTTAYVSTGSGGSTNTGYVRCVRFEGTVPSRTARIHFVGNATTDNIPGNDQIGGNENTLIKSAHMSVNLTNTTICYWGFHGEPSSEQMRDWLAVATTVDGVTTYSKDPNSMIHMIRDRARVNFRYMFDFKRANSDVEPNDVVTVNGNNYTIDNEGKITINGQKFKIDANPTDYTITQIDWILSNGLDHGYIAPYKEGAEDHFDNYYDPAANPQLKEDRLTPYDKSDGRRYTATEEDMVTIYQNGMSIDAPLFLFEDSNDPSNPPKLILRVQYTRDGKTPITKYHTLMLLNEENAPCTIYRNHSYILDIYGIPWEGIGYITFADAVNSTTYANNMTVTINEQVPEVNDGRFKLTINSDTYLIFQDPADANQTKEIQFTYSVAKAGESTSGVTIGDFTAGWATTPRPTFASPTVSLTEVSNDGSTFVGKISYTLGTSIGNNLQGGQIELHDNKTGMSRFVNIYTINKFDYLPEDAANLVLVRDGSATRNVNNIACDTYYMDVRIPGDYPIGLYPIKIRMASKTLNPFKAVRMDNGEVNTDIDVVMEETENGTVLDGETLAGMNFTTSGAQSAAWNYHAPGKPWDFWFVDEMVNKPTYEENGETLEDRNDKVYRIYFDDIRPLRDASNRADNVGLFLKIKYFGPAVSVAYAAAP